MDPNRFPLIEAAPDAVVIADLDGKILYVNAQAEVLFGYVRGELVGRPVEVLLPAPLRDAHPGHRKRYFAEPRVRSMGQGLDGGPSARTAASFRSTSASALTRVSRDRSRSQPSAI